MHTNIIPFSKISPGFLQFRLVSFILHLIIGQQQLVISVRVYYLSVDQHSFAHIITGLLIYKVFHQMILDGNDYNHYIYYGYTLVPSLPPVTYLLRNKLVHPRTK